jgi:hypothetical protein
MGRIVRIVFYSIVVLAIAYGIVYLIWAGGNEYSGAGVGLNLSYILIIIAAVGVLAASVSNFIQNPRSAIGVLVGIVLFAIIAFIGYSVSAGEIMETYYKNGIDTVKESKLVDAELYVMYGLGIIAIAAVLLNEISTALKR